MIIYAPIYVIVFIIAMIFLDNALQSDFIFYPYNLIGLTFIFLGIFLICWAALYFKVYKTTLIPGNKSSYLITKGPYRFSRNPIYLGDFLILLGFAVFLKNPVNLIFPILFVIFVNYGLIILEEKNLEKKFGEKYIKYKKKVKKWI